MERYGWLMAPLFTVGPVKVRRWHGLGVFLLALVAAVLIFALGVFAGYEYGYRTLPRPPLPPGQVAPGPRCPHVVGGCLPRPKLEPAASISATRQGPDFSNNNPVYGASRWRAIAAHNAFVFFKVNEGVGFADATAAPMARYARAQHLVVGGYDFLHVCLVSATAEARWFVAHLRADGLTGRGSFPGVGDAEFGGTGCDARAWISSWASTVKALTGRWPEIYTGAWWWQPHLGAFWPDPSLAWVSGYGVRYPFMPAGRSRLDLWQFSATAWNGVSTGDLSVWRDGAAAFRSVTLTPAPKPPAPKPDPRLKGWARALAASQRADAARACPVLDRRVAYFEAKLKRHPHSKLAASRRGKLRANRRLVRSRGCNAFDHRIAFFQHLIDTGGKS